MIFFVRGSCWVSSPNAEVHQNRVVEPDNRTPLSIASWNDAALESQVALGQSYLRRSAAQSEPRRGDPGPPEWSCGDTAEDLAVGFVYAGPVLKCLKLP